MMGRIAAFKESNGTRVGNANAITVHLSLNISPKQNVRLLAVDAYFVNIEKFRTRLGSSNCSKLLYTGMHILGTQLQDPKPYIQRKSETGSQSVFAQRRVLSLPNSY